MAFDHPVMITVAPNGARKTRADHPAIPISPEQLAVTASACLDAGACMIHLHVRDSQHAHTLDAQRYEQAIAAIRKTVGDKLIIQITTEAVGRYSAAQQIQVVREVKPEAVSLAIKELCSPTGDEKSAARFFLWLQQENILTQYILYSTEDIVHFKQLQQRGIVPQQNPSVLLVLGRYHENQQSEPSQLERLVNQLDDECCWSLCAFGATEAACMRVAIEKGGHARVGFENNLLLPDSSLAKNNEALVAVTANHAQIQGRALASAHDARELLSAK